MKVGVDGLTVGSSVGVVVEGATVGILLGTAVDLTPTNRL